MLQLQHLTWWREVFVYRGGVITLVLRGLVAYVAYTSLVYGTSLYFLGPGVVLLFDEGRSIQFLGGFVSFLLIWRLNQCYVRYEAGKQCTSVFFSALHSVAGVCCGYLRGSDIGALDTVGKGGQMVKEDEHFTGLEDALASATKVNVVRLCMAIAIAFKFHCRIAENSSTGEPIDEEQLPGIFFDLIRLKGLLFPQEHPLLDVSGLKLETDGGDGMLASDVSPLAHITSARISVPMGRPSQGRQLFKEETTSSAAPLYPVAQPVAPIAPIGLVVAAPQGGRSRSSVMVNFRRQGGSSATSSSGLEDVPDIAAQRISVVTGQEQRKGAACALPVVLLQLLRDAIAQAAAKPWGYPERTLNIAESFLKDIATTFEQLDRLITIPLPLAYLQHCKLLFLFFILTYPLTMNTAHGIWANVFSPALLFLALLGFETLADEMENPIGDDALDLNIMRMIHELEGRCDEIFAVTERQRANFREALRTPLAAMDLGLDFEEDLKVRGPMIGPGDFNRHFAWVPLPAHILSYCGEKEYGKGKQLLQAAGLQEDARTRFCRSACCEDGVGLEETIDIKSQKVRVEAEKMNLVTHFVCLQSQRKKIIHACQEQLVETLGLRNTVLGKDNELTDGDQATSSQGYTPLIGMSPRPPI